MKRLLAKNQTRDEEEQTDKPTPDESDGLTLTAFAFLPHALGATVLGSFSFPQYKADVRAGQDALAQAKNRELARHLAGRLQNLHQTVAVLYREAVARLITSSQIGGSDAHPPEIWLS